jgi:hypothetical protein
MPAIKNLLPYQLDMFGTEDETNQIVMSTFYIKNNLPTATLTYGQVLPGSATSATLLSAVNLSWALNVCTVLSAHYTFTGSRLRAIVGYSYSTPLIGITAASISGSVAFVTTSRPHGFTSGQSVLIAGVTGFTGLSGSFVATVVDAITFSVPGVFGGTYTGNGYVQLIQGSVSLTYADKDELPDTVIGSVTGDMLPAYVSADVRRINSGIGRGFRSRVGLGTLGESQQAGGRLSGSAITDIDAGMNAFTVFDNGSSDASAKYMNHFALSRYWAVLTATPFTQSFSYMAPVSLFSVRELTGSQNSRKGRV